MTARWSMSRTGACASGRSNCLQKLKRGEPVDPRLIYFRTVPKFETGARKISLADGEHLRRLRRPPRRSRRHRRAHGACKRRVARHDASLRGAQRAKPIRSRRKPGRSWISCASLAMTACGTEPGLTLTPIVIKHNYSEQDIISSWETPPLRRRRTLRTAQGRAAGRGADRGLNRPAKRNALNDGIILAIQDCFPTCPTHRRRRHPRHRRSFLLRPRPVRADRA